MPVNKHKDTQHPQLSHSRHLTINPQLRWNYIYTGLRPKNFFNQSS